MKWVCSVCGYVYEGPEPPEKCPVCKVPAEKFIDAAIEHNADVICCSALLTTTMSVMKEVVELAAEKGIRDDVKILIGGAPVTQDFCDKIGADIYTNDAASCADEALKAAEAKRG